MPVPRGRAVSPAQLWPGHLTAQHHHLMTQRDDLRVLGRITAAQQDQPAKDPDHRQVQQTNGYEARSCPITLIPPNRRSQALYRVLNRYTLQAARAVQQAAETAAALRDAREQAAAAQATARQQAAASLPAETP